jgi:hypothetical protein
MSALLGNNPTAGLGRNQKQTSIRNQADVRIRLFDLSEAIQHFNASDTSLRDVLLDSSQICGSKHDFWRYREVFKVVTLYARSEREYC